MLSIHDIFWVSTNIFVKSMSMSEESDIGTTLNWIKGTLNWINVYKFPNFGFLGLTRILYAYTPSYSIRKFRTEWQHLSQSAAPMQAGSSHRWIIQHTRQLPAILHAWTNMNSFAGTCCYCCWWRRWCCCCCDSFARLCSHTLLHLLLPATTPAPPPQLRRPNTAFLFFRIVSYRCV